MMKSKLFRNLFLYVLAIFFVFFFGFINAKPANAFVVATYSAWSSWSTCSNGLIPACGSGGTKTRTRTCLAGVCPVAQLSQSGSCGLPACAPTGTWSYPSACPTACGTATSTQTQTCTGGNGACAGSASSRTCAATAACSVNCAGTWSTCSGGSQSFTVTTSPVGTGTACPTSPRTCGMPGSCGSSNGGSFYSKPSSGLCGYLSSASGVSGSGPWNWTCAGAGGGTTASCSANKKVDGGWSGWSPASCPTACGTAASSQTRTCTNPTLANGGTTCSGSSTSACSATPACVCSAPLTKNVTVACDKNAYGYDALYGNVTRSQNKSAYPGCTFGSPVTVSNSTYVSDNCVYPPVVTGSCGSSNGTNSYSAPTSGFCSIGSASGVSGSGPWNWTCAGSGGGGTASCSANKKVDAVWGPWSVKSTTCGITADQTRTCTLQQNGGLSCSQVDGGNSTKSYTNPPCSCNVAPFGNIPSGSSVTAYSAPTADVCSSIDAVRTCTNGTLSQPYTHTFGSCAVNQYTITFNSNGGSAVASKTQAVSTPVSAPASPTRSGYTFTGWSPGVPPYMPSGGLTVNANWSAKSYSISYTATNGSVLPSTCTFGTIVNPSCTANTGYSTASCPAAFTCSTSNSGTATFSINTYTLTVNKAGTGSGTVGGYGTYNYGTTVTVTKTANADSAFSSWGGACNQNGQVTMNGNKSCTANFTKLPAPTASLSATSPISYNTNSILSWNSTNASSCTAYGHWSNSGTLSGSGWTNKLTSNTTFQFQCSGNGQTSAMQSVTVVVNPLNGACGSSNNANLYSAPSSNLCNSGTASAVSGSGPWNWTCNGSGVNHSDASCSANKKVDGGWSGWSPASCPTACGQPASTQTRTCTNPTLANGGTTCSGSSTSACSATPVCVCSAPLTDTRISACPAGYYSGSITESRNKSAYPSCIWSGWTTISNDCTFLVSTIDGLHGTINPVSRIVSPGSSTTFTVNAVTGYTASVSGCGGSLSGNTYTTGSINSNCTITTNYIAKTCSSPCGTLQNGQTCTAYSAPTADVCSSQTRTCTNGTLSGSNAYASCTVNKYNLITGTGGTGSGTITGNNSPYNYNTTVALSVTPNADSTFSGWTGACNQSGQVTMTSNKSCTANFTKLPAPTATLSATSPIPYNTNSTLSWSSTNASSCTTLGSPWSNVSSPLGPGSGWTNQLTSNTTFQFQCSGNGQTSAMQSVTVVVNPLNGACGSSNNANLYSVPSSNLCNSGTASAVSGSGPWNWTCNGSGVNHSDASCSANKKVDGIWSGWSTFSPSCPTACGQSASNQTSTRTCTPAQNGGLACSQVDGGNSSKTQTCLATPACDSCGTDSGTTPKLDESTLTARCGVGIYANSPADINTDGLQTWKWSCGTATSCSAPKFGCRTTYDSNYDLSQYGTLGPNNNYGCALTCKNGATNYSAGCIFIPTVTTSAVSSPSITQTTATGGGNITSNGGAAVTVSGLVWSISANPTYAGGGSGPGQTTDGWAIGGPWTSGMTGLTAGTTYHVRAYAVNSVGTAYGSDRTFTTSGVLAMFGSLSPATPSCSIPSGASSCNVSLDWSIVSPQAIPTAITTSDVSDINVSNFLTTPQSGTQSVAVPYTDSSSRIFYLYNNATLLGQSSATSGCVSGTSWNVSSGKCINNPGAVNGSCGVTHYNCSYPVGGSTNQVDGPSSYAWTCPGSGVGHTDASCSENKSLCVPGEGNPCISGLNFCSQYNIGNIQCDGSCSAITPPDSSCVPDTCNDAVATNFGGPLPCTYALPPGTDMGGVIINGDTGSGAINPVSSYSGNPVTITWSSPGGASSCIGTNFNTNGAPSGSVVVNPNSTITYIVVCDDPSTSWGSLKDTIKKQPIFIEN